MVLPSKLLLAAYMTQLAMLGCHKPPSRSQDSGRSEDAACVDRASQYEESPDTPKVLTTADDWMVVGQRCAVPGAGRAVGRVGDAWYLGLSSGSALVFWEWGTEGPIARRFDSGDSWSTATVDGATRMPPWNLLEGGSRALWSRGTAVFAPGYTAWPAATGASGGSDFPVFVEVQDAVGCGARYAVVGRFSFSGGLSTVVVGDGLQWRAVDPSRYGALGGRHASLACCDDGRIYSPVVLLQNGAIADSGILVVGADGTTELRPCPDSRVASDELSCAEMGIMALGGFQYGLTGRFRLWLAENGRRWTRVELAEPFAEAVRECFGGHAPAIEVKWHVPDSVASCGTSLVVVQMGDALVGLRRDMSASWRVACDWSIGSDVRQVAQVANGVAALVADRLIWRSCAD